MAIHVEAAVFVYTEDSRDLVDQVVDNPFGVKVTAVEFVTLQEQPAAVLESTAHVVVAARVQVIKDLLLHTREYDFSLGIIPLSMQRELPRSYNLPTRKDDAIELALRDDAPVVDLITCNDQLMLYKATIGRLPLLDAPIGSSRLGMLWHGLKRFAGLRLLTFDIALSNKQNIRTAACGCMIVQHHRGNVASKHVSYESSISDGMVSLIISAPSSLLEYGKFLFQSLNRSSRRNKLPKTLGLIKCRGIEIKPETELEVTLDGGATTQTPVVCKTLEQSVRINVGDDLREEIRNAQPAKETVNVKNLPRGKEEVQKATKKAIPFFAYASEERFRDLFLALRDDARTDSIYIVLMVLSTMLATVGLFQNSSAVVIGAMLLAPLMTPIISLSMGLLRQDDGLTTRSMIKIVIGVVVALLSAILITQAFTHKIITEEMQARLNPTLLDLAVAIIAGVAGAYTKAYKEILQSLAGVAIAVALVPPLAVAGIGAGRLDWDFFSQAFLLFSTNLVGIILAATFTFRVLGYSSAVYGRHGIRIVTLALILIAIPLYLSYDRIVDKVTLEKSWQHERFLVNDKYLIVRNARLNQYKGKDVMTMELLAREPLTRDDLNKFREKIQTHFERKLIIRADVNYIP